MILLKLLGLGRWLKQALSALLGFIGRHPWQALAIALLALSGWLWHGKGKAIAQRDHARAELVRQADEFAASAKEAAAKQAALTATYSAANRSLIERLDHAAALEAGAARDAADRFAVANRVRKDCLRPRATPSPAVPDPAPVNDGEADAPELVAVPRADYDQLVASALQGARAYRDATALIEGGYAVKGETVWPEVELSQ